LLADDAFDIDGGGYGHKLFQNRLSDTVYVPIFTHVVGCSQNNLTTSGGGPYKAYPLFYLIRSVVIKSYFLWFEQIIASDSRLPFEYWMMPNFFIVKFDLTDRLDEPPEPTCLPSGN